MNKQSYATAGRRDDTHRTLCCYGDVLLFTSNWGKINKLRRNAIIIMIYVDAKFIFRNVLKCKFKLNSNQNIYIPSKISGYPFISKMD